MSKSGAIVIIEDDADDRIFLEQIFKDLSLSNKLVWFEQAHEAFYYLLSTSQNIFIILSDVNLAGKSGIEFKREIDNDPKLRKKSIPFVFYSTTAHQSDINEAYTQMTVQGFFKKEMDYADAKNVMKVILDYWSVCHHPNTQ